MTLVTHWHTSRRISRQRSDVLYRKLDSNLKRCRRKWVQSTNSHWETWSSILEYSSEYRRTAVWSLCSAQLDDADWSIDRDAFCENSLVLSIEWGRDAPVAQYDFEIWHIRLCRDRTFFLLLWLSPQVRRESRSRRSADVSSNWTHFLTLFFLSFTSSRPSWDDSTCTILLPSSLSPSLSLPSPPFSSHSISTAGHIVMSGNVKRDVSKFEDLTLITVFCIHQKLKSKLSQQYRIQRDLQTRSWTKKDYVHWLRSLETKGCAQNSIPGKLDSTQSWPVQAANICLSIVKHTMSSDFFIIPLLCYVTPRNYFS